MTLLSQICSFLYTFIKEYTFYYFGTLSLFLLVLIFFLVRDKKINYKRKKINILLKTNPEKGLKKLSFSNLEEIKYFLTPENTNPGLHMKVKKHLSDPKHLKKIFNKIYQSNNKKNKNYKIKLGINIFSSLSCPQTIDYLITFLYEDDPKIINKAIDELSNYDSEKVILSFIDLLKTIPDNRVLTHLKEFFVNAGQDKAKKLIPFSRESDPTLKVWCIDVFGTYQAKPFYNTLIQFLSIENPQIKTRVIKNLEYFYDNHTKEISNKLIACLNDEDWGVKCQTAKLLGELQCEKSAPHLAELLTDNNGAVRSSAALALLNLGYKGIEYLFKIAKTPEAPKEVTKLLEEQEVSFLIEAFEHIYSSKEKSINNFVKLNPEINKQNVN